MNGKRPLRPDEDSDPEDNAAPLARRPRTDGFSTSSNEKLIKLHYDDYKVAWICALPTELAAAEVMLDCYHETLPSIREDNNHYILGSVAAHNVVIACLPKGVYGTWSAAHVMNDMRRTFPALRWGLMVGIGGGIPSDNNDIRLGDVVIGTKVAPYGPGKITGAGLLRTAESVLPDDALLKVVMRLEAKREQNAEKTSTRMAAIIEDRIKKLPDYGHPSLPDDLFDPAYTHVGPPSQDCRRCCDSQTHAIHRPVRPTNNPRIHSGVIASGDHLIRESDARDALAKELDAVCFEMEAAGLMRILPCLPIRGICDYADSHKNKSWQRYAAANAASYARELLETLPAIHDRDIRHSDLRQDDSDITSQNRSQEMHQNLRQDTSNDDRRKQIINSFKFDQMDLRRRTMRAKYRRTCQWLLKQAEYSEWLDPSCYGRHQGFLWIKGKPGTGKSTIMKFAHTTELKNAKMRQRKTGRPELVISFFFFAAGGDLEKSVSGMYRSLLVQILEGYPELQDVLDDMVPGDSGEALSLPELEDLFREVIDRLENRNLTCFIDALDEGGRQDVVRMVRQFQDLIEDRDSDENEVRICFSSRHYPFIEPRIGIQVVLEDLPGHARDLEQYIDGNLDIRDASLREELRTEILIKAQRVFLWAVLVVDEVNAAHAEGLGREAELQRLGRLPPDLHMLFRYILERHPSEMTTFVHAAAWILFSKRSLSPEEFDHALLAAERTRYWREPDSEFEEDRLQRRVISASKGLAEITTVAPTRVQFIHESVRDFLIKDGGLSQLWPEAGADPTLRSQLLLRDSCYHYILHRRYHILKAEATASESYVLMDNHGISRLSYPFLGEYASSHVLHHANEAALHEPQSAFLKSFQVDCWIELLNRFERFDIRRLPLITDLIYLLADRGYGELIRQLPPGQPLETDGRFIYPFLAAVACAHLDATAALLGLSLEDCRTLDIWSSIKTKASIQSCLGRTPVSWAAQEGSTDLVRLLVDLGHSPGMVDSRNRSPLSWALLGGHKKVVEYLVCNKHYIRFWPQALLASFYVRNDAAAQIAISDHNFNANTQLGHIDGLTPIEDQKLWASWMPSNSPYTGFQTPLRIAAALGMCETALALLERKAAVNEDSPGQGSSAALCMAAGMGHLDMVKLLLQHGANSGPWGLRGSDQLLTPFERAMENSHEDVAVHFATLALPLVLEPEKLMLRAAAKGMNVLVKWCFEQGAAVNTWDGDHMTALMHAALGNHTTLVEWLISRGALIDATNRNHLTACSIAANAGHYDLALTLLNHSNFPGIHDQLLSVVVGEAHYKNAFPLIEKLVVGGADVLVRSVDGLGIPLLVAACRMNALSLVQRVVERGAKVDFCTYEGESPLMAASANLSEEIVSFLISQGADIQLTNDGRGVVAYALDSVIQDTSRKRAFIIFLRGLGADIGACDLDTLKWLMESD